MSEETLTVKKSAVLEAMKQCPQAKSVLETIFGEQVKPKGEWEDVTENGKFVKLVSKDGRLGITIFDPSDSTWMSLSGPAWFVKLEKNKRWNWHEDGSICFGTGNVYEVRKGKIWRRK